jgi:hypothetical protein
MKNMGRVRSVEIFGNEKRCILTISAAFWNAADFERLKNSDQLKSVNILSGKKH